MAKAKAAPAEKRPVGRPNGYSRQKALAICNLVSVGKSIRKICAMGIEGFPSSPDTIYEWLCIYPEFSELYAKAKEQMVIVLGEEILEIADDTARDVLSIDGADGTYEALNGVAVNRARLQVDSRKWLMGKLLPHKYGEPKFTKDTEGADATTYVIKGGLPKKAQG